jgi:hypothetical protein
VETENYFKNFFKTQDNAHTTDQVGVASLFTRMISEDEARDIYMPVSLKELKLVLSLFKKDKILGHDGWMVEFFLHFFDLVSEDLLAILEDARSNGHIVGSIISTFLALIPKINKPQNYGDYIPISLCNLLYKLFPK